MIRRELAIFLIVGSATVFIDFLTYRSLILMGLVGIDCAKTIGFLLGTLFAYFANRIWTFGRTFYERGSTWRFVALYLITLGINVWINQLVLALMRETLMAVPTAFILATGVSAILNFLGMKLFVFKSSSSTVML